MRVVIPARRRVNRHRHRHNTNTTFCHVSNKNPITMGDWIVILIIVVTFITIIMRNRLY